MRQDKKDGILSCKSWWQKRKWDYQFEGHRKGLRWPVFQESHELENSLDFIKLTMEDKEFFVFTVVDGYQRHTMQRVVVTGRYLVSVVVSIQ